jgi:hypothetical protein
VAGVFKGPVGKERRSFEHHVPEKQSVADLWKKVFSVLKKM